jgi:hypothetical protein
MRFLPQLVLPGLVGRPDTRLTADASGEPPHIGPEGQHGQVGDPPALDWYLPPTARGYVLADDGIEMFGRPVL